MKELSPSLIEKYALQVPRYTSYPPATQFKKCDGNETYLSCLERAQGSLSLYIHIPFCMKLCYYCGCNMRVVNDYDPIQAYLETLKKEILLVCAKLSVGLHVTNIHFGGGSPTSIRPVDFMGLMDFIRRQFDVDNDAEISVEADPRNMSEGRIATYATSGVNRISMGVQDFDEEVLRAVNRQQPFYMSYDAFNLCRAYGIDNMNMDLMYGLPYQTVPKMVETMENAILMRPQRIAFFGYAHVPWMKRHMNLIQPDTLPNALERYELYKAGVRVLVEAGYCPVGIDHFVLPEDSMKMALDAGTLRRNFQGYTTDVADTLLGLGVSSIGEFTSGYIQNETDIRLYDKAINSGNLAAAKVLVYGNNDLIYKQVIEKIMCNLNIDLSDIEKECALPDDFFEPCLNALRAYEADGLVDIVGKKITVRPEARILTRLVCQAFDCYAHHDSAQPRHACAV